MIRMNDFWGNLTDISAKNASLCVALKFGVRLNVQRDYRQLLQ